MFDFAQLYGRFYIEEFLNWLVEVERFFESEGIAEKKQVNLLRASSEEKHGLGGSNCKGCVFG